MRRTFWGSTICTKTFWGSILLAGSLCATPLLQAQQVFHQLSGDLAVTYSIERAKIASIDCGCFWLQGGSVSGAISLFHGLGIAANFTGEHAANIAPGEDLSKIAFMAGPRYTLHASHGDGWFSEKRRITLFGEALFGVAHGFDSVFPTSSGFETSANSFSLQVGGGLNLGLTKHFGVRAFEADYVHTSLPNSLGNTQNDFRLAFGVTYHLGN
jgi:hypothetical protein